MVAYLLTLLIILGVMTACSSDGDISAMLEEKCSLYHGSVEQISPGHQKLYDDTVMVLLEEDLWAPRDMYDAAHYLMIPMYYAFYSQDTEAISAFGSFFSRFADDILGEDSYDFDAYYELHQLQFCYLFTQYMNLCAANGYQEQIPGELPLYVEKLAKRCLMEQPSNWGVAPTAMERIQQILAEKEFDYAHYSWIVDMDRFALAILCDLHCYTMMQGGTPSDTMRIAADLAYQMFSSPALNTETENGGWLFQVGVHTDHPNYAYAGHSEIVDNMQPMPRSDTTEDTSHFHRMPLLLRSYQSAQMSGNAWNLFNLRQEQLADQMVNCVLTNVDGQWLTTTFMDGTNGVYNYSAETGTGLAGYDLSGTFLMGWWSLLEDERIIQCYADILRNFPMSGDLSNPYFDHKTTREQNQFFDADFAFENGMFECIVACASKMTP